MAVHKQMIDNVRAHLVKVYQDIWDKATDKEIESMLVKYHEWIQQINVKLGIVDHLNVELFCWAHWVTRSLEDDGYVDSIWSNQMNSDGNYKVYSLDEDTITRNSIYILDYDMITKTALGIHKRLLF